MTLDILWKNKIQQFVNVKVLLLIPVTLKDRSGFQSNLGDVKKYFICLAQLKKVLKNVGSSVDERKTGTELQVGRRCSSKSKTGQVVPTPRTIHDTLLELCGGSFIRISYKIPRREIISR